MNNHSLFRRLALTGVTAIVGLSLVPAVDAQRRAPRAAANAAPMSDEAIRAKVDALLTQMTPEEKAGQVTQYFDFYQHPKESMRVVDEMAAGTG